jgi:hypothetical protein
MDGEVDFGEKTFGYFNGRGRQDMILIECNIMA